MLLRVCKLKKQSASSVQDSRRITRPEAIRSVCLCLCRGGAARLFRKEEFSLFSAPEEFPHVCTKQERVAPPRRGSQAARSVHMHGKLPRRCIFLMGNFSPTLQNPAGGGEVMAPWPEKESVHAPGAPLALRTPQPICLSLRVSPLEFSFRCPHSVLGNEKKIRHRRTPAIIRGVRTRAARNTTLKVSRR
jgi:hypothetical protein